MDSAVGTGAAADVSQSDAIQVLETLVSEGKLSPERYGLEYFRRTDVYIPIFSCGASDCYSVCKDIVL
jgi:hypothetical protein